MNAVRTRYRTSTLGIPSLVFIYILFGILTILFSATLFAKTIQGSTEAFVPTFAVFLAIPAVLVLFLAISVIRLGLDVWARRAGSRLQSRLLWYFVLAAVLASTPATIINTRFVLELVRVWKSADLYATVNDAQWFALDAYQYRLTALGSLAAARDFRPDTDLRAADESLLAVQEFALRADGNWEPVWFTGTTGHRLTALPGTKQGFMPRNPALETDFIRYVDVQAPGRIQVLSFGLGRDFDRRVRGIENAKSRLSSLEEVEPRLGTLLLVFYAVFSLPTLLMTIIIAVSLSAAVTQPVVELAEATKRVAEGDFSIRLLSRPSDELGTLINSFNAMVHDLEASRAAALRAEKINVWQDIAQRLAHEIKNPLTPIKLSAERVLKRFKTDPAGLPEILESSMMAIIQEVDGLANLLGEFRTFARLPAPVLSPTLLAELIEQTCALYRTSYPGVAFDYRHVDPGISVKADRRHLAQVLTNIMLNGIDAMDGQGSMKFTADLVKKRDSRYCRLSIGDSGKGIPEQFRDQVFTPYFTTKASGTGLGLPIVERIVTDHGGSIWFDSAPGAGTTFYIDLPVDARPGV